ncbi:MAG: hypothetical protein LQ337_002941 [Flavoplaca oasis]|nr:MAG: hypothetical protein LQ337_002941 [Flavoplaca oasis]
MRFGKTLRASIYEPWKDQYIDYSKLKHLLREDGSPNSGSKDRPWTEADEGAFVEELVNVQLEKVNAFHDETYRSLRHRVSDCESEIQNIAMSEKNEAGGTSQSEPAADGENQTLSNLLEKLDSITKEISELEKYSRINYTGFLKAAKKHDRRRGSQYRVRPLLQVRLAALPFNSEDYSPMLYQLSAMYSFVRQRLHKDQEKPSVGPENREKVTKYKSYKFWVHPENLLEVKTYILRRLPVLVYNPQTSKVAEGGQQDPRITSLYFDSPDFSLYSDKVAKISGASSLRLRWFGHLNDNPDILIEKKTTEENGNSEEVRFPIKMKYIQPFISGEYKMEKSLNKLQARQGAESDAFKQLRSSVDDIQTFIKESQLQPMLRANYTRTAFQIPGDDRVRISLDTDVAFLREDSLDQERPCRDLSEWHRTDIDASGMEFPFEGIRRGEISRFPYALLEIKIRDGVKKRTNEWVGDLMSSHLVKDAARFSKFVHGVAQLFEDYVNSFPFWLSELETDIRKDPETAFQEEQEKKAKHAEEEQVVGSYMGSSAGQAFTAGVGSPAAKYIDPKNGPTTDRGSEEVPEKTDTDEDEEQLNGRSAWQLRGLQSFLPSFSGSKYSRSRRRESVRLPPGVREPGHLIKDTGPVRVEPKVWLANERTFVKWQHISVLLATLSLSLYNAAGENNGVARSLAVTYTLIAAAAGGWGWWVYTVRSRMIEARSGKDFDNIYGPIVVCLALIIALCINFGLQLTQIASQSLSLALAENVNPGFLVLTTLKWLVSPMETFRDPDEMEGSQSVAEISSQEDPWLSFSSAESLRDDDWQASTCSDDGSSQSSEPTSSLLGSEDTTPKGPTSWKSKAFTARSVRNSVETLDPVIDGALIFSSAPRTVFRARENVDRLFALLSLGNGGPIFEDSPRKAHLADCMTFSLNEDLAEPVPWSTLEEPSMARCFGRFAGTVTLSRYVSELYPPTNSAEEPFPFFRLKKIHLSTIFERLKSLQDLQETQFEPTEQEEDFLYGQLVSDPELGDIDRTHARDIQVLSAILNHHVWTDFTEPFKQSIAQHFTDEPWDLAAESFFHQVILSIELSRRIHLLPTGVAIEGIMTSLPRKVAWTVALSQRVLQSISFQQLDLHIASPRKSDVVLYQNKTLQLAKLLEVGYALNWPGMEQLEARTMVESESDTIRCSWSPSSLTFLSGAILPGPVTSWIILSCLLDCNPGHRSALIELADLHAQTGFQYLGATYWYWECIVGKVLGAMQGSNSVAGWIGPCMYTPDLERVQCIRVNQERPARRMRIRDIATIGERTDPLRSWDDAGSISEYTLVLPNFSNTVDNVGVEKLAIKDPTQYNSEGANEHQVAVQIAVDGISEPIRLRYNVSFIAAASCSAGPHLLHRKYAYKTVRVDRLVYTGWAVRVSAEAKGRGKQQMITDGEEDDDEVLVIEAYGVADNAVLARAW